MYSRDEIIDNLISGTSLVEKFFEKKISLTEFIDLYNNFYFSAALDGHEATTEEELLALKEFSEEISIHRTIQEDILNRVFFGNEQQRQQYLDAGRIDADQANAEMETLCRKINLGKIIAKLKLAKNKLN